MAYIEYNPNPCGRKVGDCAVRAVAKALDTDWETAFLMLAKNGFAMGDMPSSDSVWGSVLRQNGFIRAALPDTCPECYNVIDFCRDHPEGTFVLGFGGHTACVKDGNLVDSWNSEMEIPQFMWFKKEDEDGVQ